MKEFEDIIHLPRPKSKNHPPMPLVNRAAQFGAFRALTGLEDSLSEEARITDRMVEVDYERADKINRNIAIAKEKISIRPLARVVYFVPDKKKDGGQYVEYKGYLRVIDTTLKKLTFTDGTKINFESLFDFECIE